VVQFPQYRESGLVRELKRHFNDDEIVELTAAI